MVKKAFTTLFISFLSVLIVGCESRIEPTPEDTVFNGQLGDSSGSSDRSNFQNSGLYGGVDSINPNAVDGSAMNFNNTMGLESRDGSCGGGNSFLGDENLIRGQFNSVNFGFDQSYVTATERPKLRAVADYLQSNPQTKIIIEGHCDWRGTTEYNMSLGDRRARSCQQFLVSLGVPSSSIEILSKGDQESTQGGNASVMAEDRRGEFVILKQ